MSSLLVLLIISGCAAGLYFKGAILRSFAMVIAAICAGIVAFAYFESLAGVFINKDLIVPWAQSVSFLVLFIIASAILQTVVILITRKPVDLGFIPERIGRIVCGVFLGLVISGILLTSLAMAPLSNNIPYQRFSKIGPDVENPSGTLFNADSFTTGCFNLVSSGSFSGKKSFAVLHAAFLDQLFLNRHGIADDVSVLTKSQAIEVRKKRAAWLAPESLRSLKDPNEPMEPKSGHNLAIVRVGIKKSAEGSDKFTLSQLRLVCKQKDSSGPQLAGKGICVYPIGYIKTANRLEMKKLNETIKIGKGKFKGKVKLKWIDFAFYVPEDFVPVLVEFKQNSVVQLPSLLPAEKAPAPVSF